MPVKGFTDEDVAQLGQHISNAVMVDYVGRAPASRDLVSLQDEQGWTVCSVDIKRHKALLIAILLVCQSYVPGIGFLFLAIVKADSLSGKLLLKDGDQEQAWKYPRGDRSSESRCLLFRLF